VFRESVYRTIDQLVDDVQLVSAPVSVDELARLNKSGMIVVRATGLSTEVQIEAGSWTNSALATAVVSASITIDTKEGRLFESFASGDTMTGRSGGVGCGLGTTALGQASEASMVNMLGKLGDRIVNLERLRDRPE